MNPFQNIQTLISNICIYIYIYIYIEQIYFFFEKIIKKDKKLKDNILNNLFSFFWLKKKISL
jgi:hypothetical protein